MLTRLLLKKQRPVQLTIAMLGSIFGMLLLLGAIQLYSDISNLLKGENGVLNAHYLVINKEVSVFNTLSIASTGFTESEITDLKQQAFTERLSGFNSCLFSARAFVDANESPNFPPLYTDLFFESIPNHFLDVKPDDWNWDETKTSLPIVVPADYMNLYNFGFAPSQGLPQLSKNTVKLARFKIKIWGNNQEDVLQAHIAGFSNRINTILVPESFLIFANKKFGSQKIQQPSRIILQTPDPSAPALQKYLLEKGYETNEENLKNSKLNSLLRIVVKICLSIGILIVVLSLLGFIQYSQLIINQSTYELQTLIKLGYNFKHLWHKYILFYALLFGLVFAIGLAFLILFKANFNSFMQENGFEIEEGLNATVYIIGFLLCALLFALNGLNAFINLKNLAKMKNR